MTCLLFLSVISQKGFAEITSFSHFVDTQSHRTIAVVQNLRLGDQESFVWFYDVNGNLKKKLKLPEGHLIAFDKNNLPIMSEYPFNIFEFSESSHTKNPTIDEVFFSGGIPVVAMDHSFLILDSFGYTVPRTSYWQSIGIDYARTTVVTSESRNNSTRISVYSDRRQNPVKVFDLQSWYYIPFLPDILVIDNQHALMFLAEKLKSRKDKSQYVLGHIQLVSVNLQSGTTSILDSVADSVPTELPAKSRGLAILCKDGPYCFLGANGAVKRINLKK